MPGHVERGFSPRKEEDDASFNVLEALAEHAADIRSVSQCPYQDAFIAATAKVHNLTLATRNTGDFEACGIDLVNPWEFNDCGRDRRYRRPPAQIRT